MTDFTPEQLEWAARLLCVARDINPDMLTRIKAAYSTEQDVDAPSWKRRDMLSCARRLLAELERQGLEVRPKDHD